MSVRDHFVYTAYDCDDRVLYVGCTKDLDGRKSAHRSQSDWFDLAVRFHLRGPYDYEQGRQVERERLAVDRPLYAFHPKRRTYNAIYQRVLKREHSHLCAQGQSFWEAFPEAQALADSLVPGGGRNRSPLDITDDLLRMAFAAEQKHVAGLPGEVAS